jgi:hypothetical protein
MRLPQWRRACFEYLVSKQAVGKIVSRRTNAAFDAKTGRLTDIDTEGSTVLQDEHYAWQPNESSRV